MNPLEEIQNQLSEDEEFIPKARYSKNYFDPSKAHSPIQLMLGEREKDYFWDTKTVIKDRVAYYILSHKVLTHHGESTLIGILQWSKEKKLHIKQVLKVLRNKINSK